MSQSSLSKSGRLPEELWRQIFWEASTVPGIDEFSHDAEAHFNDKGDTVTSCIGHDELQISLKCRLHMILVCRAWYLYGISILWAHLRLPLREASTVLCTLQRKHELGEYVQRISPREPELYLNLHAVEDDGTLQAILRLCPRIFAIFIPIYSKSVSEFPQSLKHIHLNLRMGARTFPILPQNITSLRLYMQHKNFWRRPVAPIEFPKLESLDIQHVPNNDWIDNWSLPSLRMLALPSCNVSSAMRILEWYATTVSVIRISRIRMTPGWNGIHFELPNLRHIYIAPYTETATCLVKLPTIPHLQIISIYWPYHQGLPASERQVDSVIVPFLEVLNKLHSWIPQGSTLRFLGYSAFSNWLLRRKEVREWNDMVRGTGRRVERQALSGDFVEMKPES